MKKMILGILTGLLIVGLNGCGDSNNNKETTPKVEKREVKPDNSVPEYEGLYIQDKYNEFTELKKHPETAKWMTGRYSYERSAIAKDENGFIINKFPLKDFKNFISKTEGGKAGTFYLVDTGTKQGLNNEYYWIVPNKSLDVKFAKTDYTHKAKFTPNLNTIYYIILYDHGPSHYLVEFF